MTFLRFFLLLSSSALIVWGDRNVDSNDLLKQMFGITRDESKSMEDLQQRFVDDHGNINKNGYDEALKKEKPELYKKMVKFRRAYNEVNAQSEQAARFIEVLYRVAGNVRYDQVTSDEEKRAILDNFDGLTPEARTMLVKKFPALKSLGEFQSVM